MSLKNLILSAVFSSTLASFAAASCIDIHPPASIGQLTLLKPAPKGFAEKYKMVADKENPEWFHGKAFDYRVVDGKTVIIQFTPAKYKGCVTFEGQPLNKKLKFDQYGKKLSNCKVGPSAYGGSTYECPGYNIQQSSAAATWPHPIFRIDENTMKMPNPVQ